MKQYYVYIMTNERNTVLYTGFSSDLVKRVYEHKNKLTEGFSSKYNLLKLVFYEILADPMEGIKREKQIKGGSRAKKIKLIEQLNPGWKDLYESIL